jgi:uncharacterized protein (TIGR02611 family)
VAKFFFQTVRQAKRAIIAVIGFTLLACGIVMLVTPGPGWLVIFLGLTVLGVEFVWAKLLLKRLKEKGAAVKRSIFGTSESS